MDPFAPTPWEFLLQRPYGRFDDPRIQDGFPTERCFRVIYCATQRAGAFGETVAHFRHRLDVLAQLADVIDEDEPADAVQADLVDPEPPHRPLVTSRWRLSRRMGATYLDPSLRFVDISAPETHQHLRQVLAPVAVSLDITDIDLSAVSGPQRQFTQECSRYIYDLMDVSGNPVYAGIRYVSRLNLNWECWAIFDGRFRHTPLPGETIHPHDPGLMEAARLFELSIEGVRPGQYLRP